MNRSLDILQQELVCAGICDLTHSVANPQTTDEGQDPLLHNALV